MKRRLLLSLGALLYTAALSTHAAPAADTPRILVYGDSITWGYVPTAEAVPPQRYPLPQRWTGIVQKELGEKFVVLEEGLNGRTAGVDAYRSDVYPNIREDLNLNGRNSLLPIVRSHEPLALVVIMLGTNDTRTVNRQSVEQITASAARLIELVKQGSSSTSKPKILLVAPPPGQKAQSELFNTSFAGSYEAARALGAAYQQLAEKEQVEFFDAASVVPVADGADGIHLTVQANQKLGTAIATKIQRIF